MGISWGKNGFLGELIRTWGIFPEFTILGAGEEEKNVVTLGFKAPMLVGIRMPLQTCMILYYMM